MSLVGGRGGGGGGRYVSLVVEGAIRVTGGRGGNTCHWWERGRYVSLVGEGAIRVTGGRGRYVSLVGGGDTCHGGRG